MPKTINANSCTIPAKCSSGMFKRVNYFSGMLLTEQDFQDEQDYLREKLKLHNRLHGAGVVWGLGLVSKCLKTGLPSPDDETFKIFVEAGFAIDCEGNEIIVCKDQIVPLDERILDLRRRGLIKQIYERIERGKPTGSSSSEAPVTQLPDDRTCDLKKEVGPKLYIGIKYCECKSEPVAQYTSDCDDDELHPQFSRVREGFAIYVYTEDELPRCRICGRRDDGCISPSQDCPGLFPCCEEEHVIILGCIEDYDAASLSFNQSVINSGYKPPQVYHHASVVCKRYARWEAMKRVFLEEVCFAEARVDYSGVIGLTPKEAEEYLDKIGLRRGEIMNYTKARTQLERVTNAIPSADAGTTIDLVVDQEKKCVVFALSK